MPNFIVHGPGGSARTDIDVLGVRLPYSCEYPFKDDAALGLTCGKTDVVIAESKESQCRINDAWYDHNLEYALKRVGVLDADSVGPAVATMLRENQRFEDGTSVIRILCFGSESNNDLGQAVQILWPHALKFIQDRFWRFRGKKRDYQQWDPFAKYLCETLTASRGDPRLREIIDGWEVKRQCHRDQPE
jgi:hypothetical protein